MMIKPSAFKQRYDEICVRKTDVESRLALCKQQYEYALNQGMATSKIMEERAKLLSELRDLTTELAQLRLQRHDHHRSRATRGD